MSDISQIANLQHNEKIIRLGSQENLIPLTDKFCTACQEVLFGLSRKHIMEGINGSLRRLGVDYVDLYQAHRYDYETPLEETMQAFADVVRAGKALYIGVSEWTAEQIRAGQELAGQMGFRIVSNQPQYSALWRVIEEKVVPASQELGLG